MIIRNNEYNYSAQQCSQGVEIENVISSSEKELKQAAWYGYLENTYT